MMDGEDFSSYPVLVGVAPDAESPAFEHLESVDATEDTFSETDELLGAEESSHRPYPVRRLADPNPPQPVHQDNCVHSTVTRQWTDNRYNTCNSCGRKPFLRWFYFCTEDTSDYTASIDRGGSLLSEWITEAILKGEYTDVQKDKLLEQKLRVLEMVELERSELERNLAISEASLCTSQGAEYQYEHPFPVHQSRVGPEAGPNFRQPQVHSRPARCQYRACYSCDRKLQERTWLSLNAVCDDPDVRPPNAGELWRIPISDADIVRNLGLRAPVLSVPPPPLPPPHNSQYVYRASRHHRIRPNMRRQYIPGYQSCLLVDVMSNLSTIEEVGEEVETRMSEVCVEPSHGLGAESLAPCIVSDNREQVQY
ncbi:hypothetical protein BJX76DRAFT_343130 [Aspergillus varians]